MSSPEEGAGTITSWLRDDEIEVPREGWPTSATDERETRSLFAYRPLLRDVGQTVQGGLKLVRLPERPKEG